MLKSLIEGHVIQQLSRYCSLVCTTLYMTLNPLTPVQPVTSHDEPWPFFHFWCHHFWPKLASSIVNFCRRKIYFQWCPDESDRPNGTWDMHKNAQKVEWKTLSKISCHYTWLLHGKNCPSWWRFLRSFLTASKPVEKVHHCSGKKRRKRKGEKKIQKSKSLKMWVTFSSKNYIKILISVPARTKMS